MFKNMEHFFKENECSHCIANFIQCFFSSEQLKTFIAFPISYTTVIISYDYFYTTLKFINMKGVKRKAEQPTLPAFVFTKKIIHNGKMILSFFFLLFFFVFFVGIPNMQGSHCAWVMLNF